MRIIVDFDQTIADSSKGLHDVYLIETGRNEIYNPNHKWNFEGLFPDDYKKRALELFCTKELFEVLKPFDNAVEVLTRLSEKHEIYVCTNHKADGIPFKDKWIRHYLPFAKTVYVDTFDKSITCGDIFIDDKPECLNSVEGNYKHIWCYGEYDWNKGWNGKRYLNWLSIEDEINSLVTKKEVTEAVAYFAKLPKYKIYCTARGHSGVIIDKRIYEGNRNMMEYYIYDEKTNKYMWLNNNGHCKFEEIS